MCVELIRWVSPGRGWEKITSIPFPKTWNPKLWEELAFKLCPQEDLQCHRQEARGSWH